MCRFKIIFEKMEIVETNLKLLKLKHDSCGNFKIFVIYKKINLQFFVKYFLNKF